MLSFDAGTRSRALQRMAEEEFDLLVVGGGITGVGVALDAVSRGLSVAVVERDDFASGTSGRSSRLIHGGVRYLEHFEFGVVHESLRERAILLRLAPHLVRPFRIYTPTRTRLQRATFRLGLMVYDLLGVGRNVGRDRYASQEEIAHAAPGLGRPVPGVMYFECQTDDARLVIEVARAAHRFGALLANHAEVVGLLGGDRVAGARIRDRLTGETCEVRARLTVNAAGVWADRVQAMATDLPHLLHPSKGVHLVFGPGAIDIRTGVLIPTAAGDRRWLFVIPLDGRVYVGTTDVAYHGDPDRPEVTPEDHDYILSSVQASFPGVTSNDVVAAWAGLRPLLRDHPGDPSPTTDLSPPEKPTRTADLSRRHAVYERPPGLLTITGGKLTTYRAMAEQLVDRAVRDLGERRRCRTKKIHLGFDGDLEAAFGQAEEGASELGLPAEAGRRMVYRYGDDWVEALRLIREDPSLGEPAVDGVPVLKAELEMARLREMALTDDDVLVRRTRLTTLDARAGEALRSSAGSGLG